MEIKRGNFKNVTKKKKIVIKIKVKKIVEKKINLKSSFLNNYIYNL